MPDDVIVLKMFSNEFGAGMAQQVLKQDGVRSFISKDDAGGMEPHLQRTAGVRLLINRVDAVRANQILDRLTSV